MELEDARRLIASTAINSMLASQFFDICILRKVSEALGIIPHREIFKMLEALHCVYFHQMPTELRTELPALILKCLTVEPVRKIESQEVVVKRGFWVRALARG